MLGPLLFLLIINDLPNVVSVGTTVCLFADDCLVYREIKSVEDQEVLQRDLIALDNWARRWDMHFNLSKWNIMTVHRSRFPYIQKYELCIAAIEAVKYAKYLGITQ